MDGFLPLEEDSTTHETPTLTLPSDFVVSAMFSPVQHDVIDVVSSVSPLSLGLMDSQSSGTESEVDSDVVDVSSSHLKVICKAKEKCLIHYVDKSVVNLDIAGTDLDTDSDQDISDCISCGQEICLGW